MSSYTTLHITRSRAMQEYLKMFHEINTDRKLENCMDELLKDRLYNCVIVNDDQENDDDRL